MFLLLSYTLFLAFVIFFLFQTSLQHVKVPQSETEPAPKQWSKSQQWQCQFLNLLHQKGTPCLLWFYLSTLYDSIFFPSLAYLLYNFFFFFFLLFSGASIHSDWSDLTLSVVKYFEYYCCVVITIRKHLSKWFYLLIIFLNTVLITTITTSLT